MSSKNKINSYKDLTVWQKSMDLVVEVYKLTEKLPKTEVYGLSSQIKRCAVSIPSNIAEGQRKFTKKEFMYFLHHAYGSGAELETQVELVKRLNLVETFDYQNIDNLLEEIMKMLNVLLRKLNE